jgi:type I restriction enzyme R subunit
VRWLEMIRDQVANSAEVRPEDFDYVPFVQHGGLARATIVFGGRLERTVDEINAALSA